MKTITVFSLKAGTGKTTVCLSLALAARQAGLKVVVADVDPLHCAGQTLRDRPEADSLLIETSAAKLGVLKAACHANGCDLLIIDTPAAPDADVRPAVEIADLALAVAGPGLFDLVAARPTARLARRAGARAAVLLNRCPPGRIADGPGLVARTVAALLFGGTPLARTRLGRRPAYHQAFAAQDGVSEWNPWRAFATDVRDLLAETAGELFWERRARPGPSLSSSRAAYVEGPPAGALPASPPKQPAALELSQDAGRRIARPFVDDEFYIPPPRGSRAWSADADRHEERRSFEPASAAA